MNPSPASWTSYRHADEVSVQGPLGVAMEASRQGRLKQFITDETSEAVRIYSRALAETGTVKRISYQGEAVGKWLYAATRCFRRTGDPALKEALGRVADFLVKEQRDDGYLGTYSPEERFTSPKRDQNYDLWMNGLVLGGLLDTFAIFQDERHLAAAKKLGGLCIEV